MIASGVLMDLLMLCVILLFILYAMYTAQSSSQMFSIRRVPGLDALDEVIGRCTEIGQPVVYELGTTQLTSARAGATIASLSCLKYVARLCAQRDCRLIVPTSSTVVFPVIQGIVEDAYSLAGKPVPEDTVQWLGTGWAYDNTVAALMIREKMGGWIAIGSWWGTTIMHVETAAVCNAMSVGATDTTHNIPPLVAGCTYSLIGEEMYAAGAYLSKDKTQLGSIVGQDIGKVLILILILVSVLLSSTGFDIGTIWKM